MVALFWIGGFIVLSLVASFAGVSTRMENILETHVYFAGIAPALVAAIPAVISGIASLFKGNKTKMAPQQTKQQLALTQFLTNLAKQNLGQGAANKQPTYDALNMISRMFGVGGGNYGQQTPPRSLPAMPMSTSGWKRPQQ